MTATARDDVLQHLSAKVHDHSTVLQALQVDFRHLVKAVDKLVGVSETQAVLGAELRRHSDSIDRAFQELRTHKDEFTSLVGGQKSEFVQAIDRLSDALSADRAEAKKVADAVLQHRTGVSGLRWIIGISLPVGLTLVGLVYAGLKNEIIDARGDAAARYEVLNDTAIRERARIEAQHDRDIRDLDARADALEARR